MKRGYRIHKIRFASFLLFIAMIFSFCTVNVLGENRDAANEKGFKAKEQSIVPDYEVIFVKSGDSLWNIAKDFSDSKTDIRELIYEISKANQLADGIIHPGDQLLIPVNWN